VIAENPDEVLVDRLHRAPPCPRTGSSPTSHVPWCTGCPEMS
jgi:hypothetical protein